MSIRVGDVDRMWSKLGFERVNTHHMRAIKRMNGKIVATTRYSHGSGQLEPYIVDQIRKQMHLTRDQFALAIECPLTVQEYHQILIDLRVY